MSNGIRPLLLLGLAAVPLCSGPLDAQVGLPLEAHGAELVDRIAIQGTRALVLQSLGRARTRRRDAGRGSRLEAG